MATAGFEPLTLPLCSRLVVIGASPTAETEMLLIGKKHFSFLCIPAIGSFATSRCLASFGSSSNLATATAQRSPSSDRNDQQHGGLAQRTRRDSRRKDRQHQLDVIGQERGVLRQLDGRPSGQPGSGRRLRRRQLLPQEPEPVQGHPLDPGPLGNQRQNLGPPRPHPKRRLPDCSGELSGNKPGTVGSVMVANL